MKTKPWIGIVVVFLALLTTELMGEPPTKDSILRYQVRATIYTEKYAPIQQVSFGPFSDTGLAERCVVAVAGRENCMGASIVPMEIATTSACAPGRGMFNRLYGSGGWGSSESECPPGGCPHESGGNEEAVKPPSHVVHVNGASGVIIAMGGRDAAILTAYHVVEGHKITGIPVQLTDGTKCKAEICLREDGSYSIDKAADIALIRIKAKKDVDPFCSLAYEQPKVGDAIWTCGYGPNNVYRKIPGKVLKFTSKPYKGRGVAGDTMFVSGEAQSGDSGGPIFNAEWRVCGIVSRSSHTEPRAPDETWGTSLNRIAALCADTIFPFPWRKQVEAELEEAKQLPVPLPPALPAGLSAKDQIRLNAMETRIADLEGSLEKAKEIYAAGERALQNAQTDVGKQLAVDLAALKTKHEVTAKVAEAASNNANQAGDSARVAFNKIEEVAEEVNEDRKGLKERIAEHVGGLPVIRRLDSVKAAAGWTLGKIATVTGIPAAGVVVIALAICAVLWRRKVKPMFAADIAAYQETGDDTFLQDAAERIPGRLGKLIQAGVDRAVERKLGPAGGAAGEIKQ